MAARSATEILDVTLDRAGARAVPVLRRLMQLYLYDLGTIDGWDISSDGRFGNARSIERFWRERGRRSFFIRVGPVLGGFALGAAEIVLQAFLPPELLPFRDAIVFALVIAVLTVRPRGLLPAKLGERV